MKKNWYVLAAAILLGATLAACGSKVMDIITKEEPKLVSFDPTDSLQVDALMRFYIDSEIIPKEALTCENKEEGDLYTYDCLNEDCFITNDFIDSTSATFFVEVAFETGSSGSNSIYICRHDKKGFSILFNTEGQINNDLAPEEIINGYKTVCVETIDHQSRIIFDGTQFILEELPEEQNLVTQK